MHSYIFFLPFLCPQASLRILLCPELFSVSMLSSSLIIQSSSICLDLPIVFFPLIFQQLPLLIWECLYLFLKIPACRVHACVLFLNGFIWPGSGVSLVECFLVGGWVNDNGNLLLSDPGQLSRCI